MTLSDMTITYTHPNVDSKEKMLNLLEKYLKTEGHEKLNETTYYSSYDLNYDEIGGHHSYVLEDIVYGFFKGEKSSSLIEHELKQSTFEHTEYITINSDASFNYHCGKISVEVFGEHFEMLVEDDFYSTDASKEQFEKLGFVPSKSFVSVLQMDI